MNDGMQVYLELLAELKNSASIFLVNRQDIIDEVDEDISSIIDAIDIVKITRTPILRSPEIQKNKRTAIIRTRQINQNLPILFFKLSDISNCP